MSESNLPEKFSNFVIFKTADGKVNIDVYFQDETLWLTQKHIAELFGKGRSTITEHLKNIFAEGELDEELVCRKFRHTTEHGAGLIGAAIRAGASPAPTVPTNDDGFVGATLAVALDAVAQNAAG